MTVSSGARSARFSLANVIGSAAVPAPPATGCFAEGCAMPPPGGQLSFEPVQPQSGLGAPVRPPHPPTPTLK